MGAMEVKDVVFLLGAVSCLFIINLVRSYRLIRFLIFCGQENPEANFAKVVKPLHHVNLGIYQQSLKSYFKRLVTSDNGHKVEIAYISLLSIDRQSKQGVCRDAFSQALFMIEAGKLAEFYVTILRSNRDNNTEVLLFILEIAKKFPDNKKEIFRAGLNEERVIVSVIRPHLQASENLIYALSEVQIS